MTTRACGDCRGLSELEAELGRLGVSLYGYADVGGLFSGEWGEWPRAISLALALPVEELQDVRSGGPTPAYYDAYLAANAALNAASREVAQLLGRLGYGAKPYPATVSAGELREDLGEALTAPVRHKTVATRAGLGWIGRSGLLVTRTLGPGVRLATVFTDMPLPVAANERRSSAPIDAGQCGTCRRCVDACPAGAIQGNAWSLGTPREALVDVAACRTTAERLMRERVGRDDAVCGVCIVVCPFSRMTIDGQY